jgi:tetratricopeptide (TPR) repeat protein
MGLLGSIQPINWSGRSRNMDSISIILTVIFGIVSLVALIYAFQQGKKAKKAEKSLEEIQQAVTSYKFLKEKALENYVQGRYDESLDVFRRYLLSNKDDKEWNEIILHIFKKETEKIFSGVFSFNESISPGIAIYLQAYISFEDILNKATPYPELLKTLIRDFEKSFDRNKPSIEFIISLFDKDWQKAKNLLERMTLLSDEDINSPFKQYITVYLNKKLGITDDDFADDVPF